MSDEDFSGIISDLNVPESPFEVTKGWRLGMGFKAATTLPYYTYFEGHGGTRYQHTGADLWGELGRDVTSPVAGTVVCEGTGKGPGMHGQGCAAFADEMGNGAGRIEIDMGDGESMIFGHMSDSYVSVGDTVTPGQVIGTLGGANAPHVHLEKRVWTPGGHYTIVDPKS